MDKQEIITVLADKYRASYTIYEILEQLNKKALHNRDAVGHWAFSRQAGLEASFLDGMKAAAEALGVDTSELLAAVNLDRKGEEL